MTKPKTYGPDIGTYRSGVVAGKCIEYEEYMWCDADDSDKTQEDDDA